MVHLVQNPVLQDESIGQPEDPGKATKQGTKATGLSLNRLALGDIWPLEPEVLCPSITANSH